MSYGPPTNPPSTALSAGQIVNGKYRILRLLGDGGMGSVYEAFHELLGTRVALKLLHAELTRTGVAKRFLQEARASARIKSPHVVTIADADQTPEGLAFIVLEYIEGRTLREHYEDLAREGRMLTFPAALDYAMQMFEGVEAAHAAGIVHRDLKPDNVMITADAKGAPLLKLLDFGIAKVDEPPESVTPALTREGALLGTPEYMAPEQVYSAGSADARADVFSLGVILFEMLSGRRPVFSSDPQQIAVSYLTGAIARLEDVCPQVPPALAAAVHRALAAQPRDRFGSVAEMRAAIEPFAPPRSVLPSVSAFGPTLPPSTGPANWGHNPAPPGSAARASRPIPPTHEYTQGGTTALPSIPAPRALASASPAPPPGPASALGTVLMPATLAATHPARAPAPMGESSKPPAFAPDYPAAMAPFSMAPGAPGAPGASSSLATAPLSVLPEYPQMAAPPNPPPASPAPAAPSPSSLGSWAAPAPVSPSLAPPPGRKWLWAVVALVSLLVAVGVTLGALYYLGWLDPDPPVSPHRPPTTKPHPTSTHRPGDRPGGASH